MENLLYYPSINLPDEDWTRRAFLYYDHLGVIVPGQYYFEPDYEPFTRELMHNDLVRPFNPLEEIDNQDEFSRIFLDYLRSDAPKEKFSLAGKRATPRRQTYVRLHSGKFGRSIYEALMEKGLAIKEDDFWFQVESGVANDLMFYLATVIAKKNDYCPATDRLAQGEFALAYLSTEDYNVRMMAHKRDVILKELVPYPADLDIYSLRSFKDRHHDLLVRFRTQVDLLVLDENLMPGSPLFMARLNEMKEIKEELLGRMKEDHWSKIVFGSVCGIIPAMVAMKDNPGAVAFAGLLGAAYNAWQMIRPDDVQDRSGLKYLALVDKKLKSK